MFGIEAVGEYVFCLKGNILPITPSEISVSVMGKNQVISLINGSEINVLKKPSLATINFKCLLPRQKYPFVKVSLKPVSYYLNLFENLMNSMADFDFIIFRNTPDGITISNTVLRVSLESYSYIEAKENGNDVLVSLSLKAYKGISTKKYEIDQNGKIQEQSGLMRKVEKEIPSQYVVKKGDTLLKICREVFGEEGMCFEIAKKNGIINPNELIVGQILDLEV